MPVTVSVIITSYNYARYIDQTIRSVLNQTYRDFEVIVVDDGSTDNTAEVLRQFGDAIVCIFQPNAGKSSALNRGIDAATGQILAFVDSDDTWLPDSLEQRVRVLDEHPEVGVVYGRTQVMNGAGVLLPYCNGAPERYPGDTFRSLLYGVYIPFLTFTVRRSCLDQAGSYFNPAFGATNDWELYLRLACVCRFYYVDMPLARYRVHEANWSRSGAAMSREMARVVHGALRRGSLPAGIIAAKPVILRNLYTNIGLGFVGPGPRLVALHYFARALAVSRHRGWATVRIVYLIVVGYASRHRSGARSVVAIASLKQRLNYMASRRVRT